MAQNMKDQKIPLVAHVIVDVPSMQTDRPFDYQVPEAYDDLIEVGMRIQVPFGHREVLGYVIRLDHQTDFDGELKSISKLMDELPVLNDEMLNLGQVMAKRLFAFQIECYQTMLPRMLKANYEKYFIPTQDLTYLDREAYFGDSDEVKWEDAESRGQLKTFLHLRKEGEVDVDYRVEDKKRYKTEKWVQPLMDVDELEIEKDKLRPTAKKQNLLAEVLMELEGQRVSARTLKKDYGLSMQTLKAGEKKGWLKLFDQRVNRDPYQNADFSATSPKTLLPEQAHAYESVKAAMDEERSDVFLLQGVTGSGKTEVYLQLIQHALSLGKTALLLVPEISLTPQMVKQLKERFGDLVAVQHSQLSMGEQFDEWQRIKKGEARVAVGARSSVFAPLENLGIVIIDEEHESTYKQNDAPRYHARDVAKWRGKYHHCPVLLGSATPSLESRARAQNGVYQLLEMKERTNHHPLPETQIVDMREEYKRKNYHQCSRALKDAMDDTLGKGQQVALLLNRRGYANYVQCRDCGYVFQCPNCDVSLTYHYQTRSLQCHYCGYSIALPQFCPQCHGRDLRDFGTGTERVQEELEELFPNKTVVRMDNDTTRKKGSYERILKKVETGEADILLGTQMIAKGLDFENITLVGVINADTSLYLPDFRASERTFQLLTQVSGRAGRGKYQGHVIIQSFNPEHYAIQFAKKQDYNGFYKKEMAFRKANHYSPYYYTIRISVSSKEEKEALGGVTRIGSLLRKNAKDTEDIVLGPSQSPIARIKNRYYFQLLYQYRDPSTIQNVFDQIKSQAQEWSKKKLYVSIDVEPQTFM